VDESRRRIGQVPELWFLSRAGASQIRVGAEAPRAVRRTDAAEGKR
jgi:hypothetical protein